MRSKLSRSRRKFLQTVGAAVPTLNLMLGETTSDGDSIGSPEVAAATSNAFPVDLHPYLTASPKDFGPRDAAKDWGGGGSADGLIRLPGGSQVFRGIPFLLGPEGVEKKSWLVLSSKPLPWVTPRVEIPIGQNANFLCLCQFCDWDEELTPLPNKEFVEKVGEQLAEFVLVYEDGGEQKMPIRRHFEVNTTSLVWGNVTYGAVNHLKDAPSKLTDPLSNAMQWGFLQWTVTVNAYRAPILWLAALPNPAPDRVIKSIRIRSTGEGFLIISALTLYQGSQNPLRYDRLNLYRVTLPEAAAQEKGRWKIDTDLGIVGRTFTASDFEPEAWLSAPRVGLGDGPSSANAGRYLYTEVTASPEATLWLRDKKEHANYSFPLKEVTAGHEVIGRPSGPHIQLLEPEKVWLQGRVASTASGRPTPVRLAFRSADGRYIPPYGHRTEVNEGWFQDYGADLKLMNSSYAYVDGTFQVELPVGDVYLEMTKGFEFEAVRKKLKITSGQRELNLEISPLGDSRSKGWVSADTHVHFLPASTAILEGQAEGLNLTNLLAAQWGDMFSNVADLPQESLVSQDGETMVWMGTENRQHLLGHLGLLGGHGQPVYPMSTAGPGEGYLGEPVWNSLAEWADECRKREGVVIAAHFPNPPGEIAADIVLGKIDAVELQPIGMNDYFNCHRFLHYYRYLNTGYRLPVVGGTDKMGAFMPLGATRAYAQLGDDDFTFANWAKAVRRGNTFMSSGPLLLFEVDGRVPGAEITLGAGGGTLEVRAEAKSYLPIHRLEVIMNGRVVASREERGGSREIVLKEKVTIPGPGWLAARCASQLEPFTVWSISIAAHTSPVYVRVPGKDLFSPEDVAFLLTLIEGGQTWVENLATRPDPERYGRVRKVFVDARENLHRKLHEHGIPH